MNLFPIFLKMKGRQALVVGAGTIAEEKIVGLLRGGAKVRVVAPHATQRIRGWARAGRIHWDARAFRPTDLTGAFLVVAATASPALHKKICREARRHGILCNIVDDPPHCDFYYPSVVRRGPLQIAISTGGISPALAQRLRKELENLFGAEYAAWLRGLGRARKKLLRTKMSPERRRKLLHRLASQQALQEFLGQKKRKSGTTLVG